MARRHSARLQLSLLLLVGCLLQAYIHAQNTTATVPNIIRFSGILLNGDQTARAGAVGVTFALYSEQKGGAPLWLETQNVSIDAAGHYSVLLGAASKDGVPSDLFATNEARWLGIKPEGQDEQPRVLLVSVPYAMKAGDAETLGGKPASAFALNSVVTVQTAADVAPIKPAGSPPVAMDLPSSTGTKNFVAKWIDTSNTLGNSIITDTGTTVGINNINPSSSVVLDVSGNSVFRGFASLFYAPLNNGPQFAFQNQASPSAASWRFGVTGATNGTTFLISDAANSTLPFEIEQGTPSNTVYLQKTGKVGIGTNTPANLLTVAGTVQSTSGGFKFPDGSVQVSAGVSQSAADSRYLQQGGGSVTGILNANNASNTFNGTFAGSFSGNGSALTNLNAGAIAAGSLPNSALNGAYTNTLLMTSSANQFSGSFSGTFAGNGANLTNLNSSQLTGTLNGGNIGNIPFTNANNNFTQLQNIELSGPAGGTGVGLFVLANDNGHAAINAANAGTGDIMDMYNANQQAFAFANNGYLWSNGWAPPINFVSGNPVSPGQLVKFVRIGPVSAQQGVVMPTATTDINGAIGIVAQTYTSDPNNLQAQVVLDGIANCTFDNTPVIGDWVTISSITAGDCHDYGVGLPNYGGAVGRVVDPSGTVYIFRVWIVGPRIPQSIGLTNQTAAIPTTTLFSVSGSGLYRVTVYLTSNNTAGGTITGSLGWADGSGPQTASTGTVSPTQQYASQTVVMHVVGGNDITYNIQFSGVSGTPNYGAFYTVELLASE